MKFTRKEKLLGWAGVVCIVLASSYFAIGYLNQQSAVKCTLKWGRLAPFPPSAEQFSITAHGNMFTRQFQTSFTAPQAEIDQWLKQSPGIMEATPTVTAPGIRHFQIRPGAGAQRADVTVNDTTNLVSINVEWS